MISFELKPKEDKEDFVISFTPPEEEPKEIQPEKTNLLRDGLIFSGIGLVVTEAFRFIRSRGDSED